MADYGNKALEQLRRWQCDDEKHVAYLAEERKELDRLGAWGDIIDAVRKNEKTTNPNNLVVAWLFGMSQIDPMLPRTFIYDPSGIKERSYHFVSTDGRDVAVHFMSHVCLADGSVLRVNNIRPGFDLASNEPFKVDLIYPSFDTFVETHSNNVVMSDLSFMPVAGQHFFKQSNELPDIDVDFPPSILAKIVPLARKMYGDDRVAGVCTYMRSGVRSVIKDVARVFELPFKEVNDITTILGNESNKMNWSVAIENFEELRQFIKNYPQASNIMSILNSRVKSVGTHASALIISSVPIAGKIPMIRQAGERDEMVSSWVEGQARLELSVFGFCKFDRLGLQTLDDLAMCLDLIYNRGQLSREDGIFRLPGRKNWSDLTYLADKKALKAAARGETNGVFQFDSDGIRHLLEHIRVDKFSELVAANALYRPGVMSAVVDGIKGGHEAYYKRKHGQIPWNLHPSLEPILGDTYGLMIYQEQVMKVLEKIGGIALPDCDAVRKAISKKKLKVIAQYKPVFVRNAMKILECDEAEAEQWWNNIENWSGYGFNKCLSPTTSVIHENGREGRMKNCKPGDRIKAYNPETGKEFFDEVVAIHKNGRKFVYDVELETGEVLVCTMDHEIMCEDGIKRPLREIVKAGHRVMVEVAQPHDIHDLSSETILQAAASSDSIKELADRFGFSSAQMSIHLKRIGLFDSPCIKRGKKSWNRGLTKETDARIKKASATIGIALRGRHPSVEQKAKMSASAKQRQPSGGMKGKHHSDVTKQRLRDATLQQLRNGRVVQTGTAPHLAVKKELDLLGVSYVEEARVDCFAVDFRIGDLAIEVHGDYWHANPFLYPNGPVTKGQRVNFLRDIKKEKTLKNGGLKLLIIWESEVKSGDYRRKLRNAIQE